jgi:outer membrane protein assembly factor BamB
LESTGSFHLVAGPDLDGDGHREVFTAALISGETFGRTPNPLLLQVAAVSGADGRVLWQGVRPVSEDTFWSGAGLGPLRWCQPGADGRPQLLVAFSGNRIAWKGLIQTFPARDIVARAWLYSAGTGKVAHTLPGLFPVETADLNGDGIPDLLALRPRDPGQPTRLHAFRGSAPQSWRRLGTWHPAFAATSEMDFRTTFRVSPLLPHGDLDGDGFPDLLVFEKSFEASVGARLHAYSGKDGRRFWIAGGVQGTLPQDNYVSECFRLECRALEKEGRPKVVLVYGVGGFDVSLWGRGFGSGGPNECWLAVLSGSNGNLLWKERIGGYFFDFGRAGHTIIKCHRSIALTPPAFTNLNDDGMVVVLAQAEPTSRSRSDGSLVVTGEIKGLELRALNGRDGKVLWRKLLPEGDKQSDVFGPDLLDNIEYPFVLGPPGPDGAAEVVVATRTGLFVLDSRDGRQKWACSLPRGLGCFRPRDTRGYTPHVLADLDGTGQRSVCLPVYDTRRKVYQVLILDPPGKPRCTMDVKPAPPEAVPFRLWSQDLDGDGKEELLFVSDGKVRAVKVSGAGRQPPAEPLWEWPLTGSAGGVLDVQPACKGRPAVVAVWSGSTVYGLDGATGKPRWRCDGPCNPTALAPGAGAGGMPGIVFHVAAPESTVCRQALPVLPDSSSYGQPVTAPPIDYPRDEERWSVIPLPWEAQARQKGGRALLVGLACLALLVYAVRKRSRRVVISLLVCLLAVPLVAGAFALQGDSAFPEQHYAWGGWYWLWPFALSAPGDMVLLILGVLFCWLNAGRLRRWLLFGLLTCLLALLIWLQVAPGPSLRDGLTWKSPLVWMAALLLWPWAKKTHPEPHPRSGSARPVPQPAGATETACR